MNILYHHRTLAADAQGVHIRSMIRAFRDLGHEVREASLVSSEDQGIESTRGERTGWIAAVRRSLPRFVYELAEYAYSPAGYRRLTQIVNDGFRPDFLYERYSLGNAAGVWTAKKLSIPILIEVNAPLALEKKLYDGQRFHRLARSSERRVLSRADRVIAVSGVLRDLLVEEGVPERKIVVMPNGVDREEFTSISGDRWRESWGVGPKDVTVGFVGWFREWHGLERLIDLLATEPAREARLVVVLVGDGPVRGDLEGRARERGVSDRVKFVGPQPRGEVPNLLAGFDVAVQPSVTDYACPMKLIEYLAAGRAVVAPRKANIEELVVDGISAKLFDPEVEGSLDAAILEVAGSPRLREELARGAKSAVEDRGFFWEENARRVVSLASSLGA